jgi:nucleotide-binding universal stress UspA family protein
MPQDRLRYGRILVPLDGSALAEQVLPHVSSLAKALGSSVTLLRVVVPPTPMPLGAAPGMAVQVTSIPDPVPHIANLRREAADYLSGVAGRLAGEIAQITSADEVGQPAEAIRDHARQMGVDLIAMTTHGRSGMGRLLFGSVSESVLRDAPCPVFLVRTTSAAGSGS